MIRNKIDDVDFICVNTDAQDLKNNPVSENRKCKEHSEYSQLCLLLQAGNKFQVGPKQVPVISSTKGMAIAVLNGSFPTKVSLSEEESPRQETP